MSAASIRHLFGDETALFDKLSAAQKKVEKLTGKLEDIAHEAHEDCIDLMRSLNADHCYDAAWPIRGWLNLHEVHCSDSSGENMKYYFMTLHQTSGRIEINTRPLSLEKMVFLLALRDSLTESLRIEESVASFLKGDETP